MDAINNSKRNVHYKYVVHFLLLILFLLFECRILKVDLIIEVNEYDLFSYYSIIHTVTRIVKTYRMNESLYALKVVCSFSRHWQQ